MTTDTLAIARRIARENPEAYNPAVPGSYEAVRDAALVDVTKARIALLRRERERVLADRSERPADNRAVAKNIDEEIARLSVLCA